MFSTICFIIALVFFGLAALKVNEPAIPSWMGAGLFFLTLALFVPGVRILVS